MADGSAAPKRKPLKLDLDRITEKNIGQLKKLNTATFPVVYHDPFYETVLKNLKTSDYCRLGYYSDVLVSAICCRLEPRLQGGQALYMMTLSVLKPYQRRSLASQLVQWAIDHAQSKEHEEDDVRVMYLHVQTSNEAAITFYKSFGFEVTQTIEGSTREPFGQPARPRSLAWASDGSPAVRQQCLSSHLNMHWSESAPRLWSPQRHNLQKAVRWLGKPLVPSAFKLCLRRARVCVVGPQPVYLPSAIVQAIACLRNSVFVLAFLARLGPPMGAESATTIAAATSETTVAPEAQTTVAQEAGSGNAIGNRRFEMARRSSTRRREDTCQRTCAL